MTMRVRGLGDYTRQPWRNGGGITYEIGRSPCPDGGDPAFDWRISIAEIAESGPFSAFDGIDRIITLIDGKAMTLTVDGRRVRVPAHEPFAFDGASETSCEISSPTRDLNVMTRRGAATATMTVLRPAQPSSVSGDAGAVLILVGLAGTLTITSGTTDGATLGALDSLCWDRPDALGVHGEGTLAVIRISPAG